MNALEAHSITHRYGPVTAVYDLSFSVEGGELFGVIGPDGAGKTTLFRIAATLIIPSGGRMTLFGLNVVSSFRELRSMIGYMPGRFSLYPDLTVEENLRFYASVFGTTVRENYHLIEPVFRHLEPFTKRLAGRLSGGMKQKLALSCALIHKPQILILDEPTTGVDAVSRAEFWELLSGLKREGITIIVSTPYMDEALRCDRIALMQQGRLLMVDTPAAIRTSGGRRMWAVRHPERYRLLLALREMPMVAAAQPFGDAIHLTPAAGAEREELVRALAGAGLHNATVTETTPGIEDVFLDLMNREFTVSGTGMETRGAEPGSGAGEAGPATEAPGERSEPEQTEAKPGQETNGAGPATEAPGERSEPEIAGTESMMEIPREGTGREQQAPGGKAPGNGSTAGTAGNL